MRKRHNFVFIILVLLLVISFISCQGDPIDTQTFASEYELRYNADGQPELYLIQYSAQYDVTAEILIAGGSSSSQLLVIQDGAQSGTDTLSGYLYISSADSSGNVSIGNDLKIVTILADSELEITSMNLSGTLSGTVTLKGINFKDTSTHGSTDNPALLKVGTDGSDRGTIIIENCSFIGNGNSGTSENPYNKSSGYTLGITIDSSGGRGRTGTGGSVANLIIRDNTFENVDSAIQAYAAARSLEISGNTFTNTGFNSFEIAVGSKSNETGVSASNLTVKDNVFEGAASCNVRLMGTEESGSKTYNIGSLEVSGNSFGNVSSESYVVNTCYLYPGTSGKVSLVFENNTGSNGSNFIGNASRGDGYNTGEDGTKYYRMLKMYN